MDNEISTKTSQSDKLALPDVVEVEIQRRFNEIESKKLEKRAASIDRWLSVLGLIFTFFGLVIPLGTYLGYERFEELEGKAQELVENFEKTYQDAQVKLQAIDDLHKKARLPPTQAIKDNGKSADQKSDKAVSLQKAGKIDDAINEWKTIAKSEKEKNNNDLAARAWFFVGYLTKEKVQGDPDDKVLPC